MTRAGFEATRPTDYLTRLAASDIGAAYKRLALDELAIAPGDVVVDLGCGPGADLTAMSEATGPRGMVIGFDHDPVAVTEARDHNRERSNVALHVGDVHHLDLAPATVDRLHTDRGLQHVDDPVQVLREVARVVRPGGRAVFAEPDWDTLVIDHPDVGLASAYRTFVIEDVVRNARLGRQLRRLSHDVGMHAVRVLPVTTTFLDAFEADRVLGFQRVTERAVAAGQLTEARADEWLRHLAASPFFAAVTLFVVSCEVPRPAPAD